MIIGTKDKKSKKDVFFNIVNVENLIKFIRKKGLLQKNYKLNINQKKQLNIFFDLYKRIYFSDLKLAIERLLKNKNINLSWSNLPKNNKFFEFYLKNLLSSNDISPIIIRCSKDLEFGKFILAKTSFLKGNKISNSQRIWHLKNKIKKHPKCQECKLKCSFSLKGFFYRKTCGNKKCHIGKVSVKKREETTLKNHGVKNPMQSKKLRKKGEKTRIKKYGNKNYNNREKCEKTNLKKHGVRNVSQITKFVSNQKKSSFTTKKYILPSGNEILIQGYEDKGIQYLLKNYEEKDFVFSNKEIENEIGKIWYINPNRKRKKSRYFPDLYNKRTKTIIEIKSYFTFYKDFENNLLKQKACLKLGYNFLFLIFNQKGDLLDTHKLIKEARKKIRASEKLI